MIRTTELQQKRRLKIIYDIDIIVMERRIRKLEKEVRELVKVNETKQASKRKPVFGTQSFQKGKNKGEHSCVLSS